MTRRSLVFAAANTVVASIILGRLYQLQFMRSDEYKNLAEGNRIKLQLIAPVRGVISDRNGEPLANNLKNYRLFLDSENIKEAGKSLKELAALIAIGEDKIEQAIKQAKNSRFLPPLLLKENLTRDELAKFEFYHLNFPGVFVDIGQVRYYPLSEQASHLIGYVGAIAKDEAAELDENAVERLPDFKIGKNGVEKMFEESLRGIAGVKQVEVNSHGSAVRELSRNPGSGGKDFRLTIDARLQKYASERLGEESAAAVVMNIHNGDVLALASMPAYDPNNFSKGITNKYWAELQENIRNPLMNKAISGQYPPGSTFKIVMGIAALQNKIVDPQSRVSCNGTFMLGNHSFRCWKQGGHGSVNLREAMMGSCDVYFYTMAQRLGIDAIAETSRRFGLGKISGVGLPADKPGIVPDDDWKQARYGQSWQGGDTINVGIGQGYILATPLQLAVMTARVANGGFAVVPRLVADSDSPQFASLGISENHLTAVCESLDAVVNNPAGTAYGKRIAEEHMQMAGKTGTSQVKKLIRQGMEQSKLPWEDRHHALFVGYAPLHAPKYAAAVIVEHGGGGGAAAAPIVRDLLLKIQNLDAGNLSSELPKPEGSVNEEAD